MRGANVAITNRQRDREGTLNVFYSVFIYPQELWDR